MTCVITTDPLSLVFAALADPTRRGILATLTGGDATVTELTEPLLISMPAVSRHLEVLERAALISRSREGKWQRSHLEAASLRDAAVWIDRFRSFWDVVLRPPRRPPRHHARRAGAPMTTKPPTLSITRVFDAPRALVYRAFTDPEQLAAWWGPTGSERPLDQMDFDVRPGGFQRFVQVVPDDPSIRAEIHIDLTDVTEGKVLDGVMRVSGHLPGDFKPFETQFRFEFHDEDDGRTRLEVAAVAPGSRDWSNRRGLAPELCELDALLESGVVA